MQDAPDNVVDAVTQCNLKSIGESSTHILEQLREQQVDHSGIMVPKLQQQLMEAQIDAQAQRNRRINEQIDTLVSRMLNLSPEDVSAATRMTSDVDRNADFASLFPSESPSESVEEKEQNDSPPPKPKKLKEDRPIRKIQLD